RGEAARRRCVDRLGQDEDRLRDPIHPPLLHVRAAPTARGDRRRPRTRRRRDHGPAEGGGVVTHVRWETTRLKYAAECNTRVLSESTSGNRAFKYVDIGAVGQGSITMPDELTTFADAPSRARRL